MKTILFLNYYQKTGLFSAAEIENIPTSKVNSEKDG